VVSAVRRAGVPLGAATASTVLLRSADVLGVVAIAALLGPALAELLVGGGRRTRSSGSSGKAIQRSASRMRPRRRRTCRSSPSSARRSARMRGSTRGMQAVAAEVHAHPGHRAAGGRAADDRLALDQRHPVPGAGGRWAAPTPAGPAPGTIRSQQAWGQLPAGIACARPGTA
jgi:hypothetical protein